MTKNKKAQFNSFINESNSMKLFTMLCGYFLLVLLLFSFLQFIKCINLGVIQILSIVIPIIVFLLNNNSKKTKLKVIIIIIYLIIVLILPFLYNKTYDLTQDGNSYHKTSIAYIKNGWNPLYESMKTFQKKNNNVIEIQKNSRVDLWSEHYPKATWIVAAVIYNMTGNIESGKCISLIFSIMLLIICENCLNKILDKKWSIIISMLLVLNPIILAQFFTYYVDGIMGICFAIELLILITLDEKKKINFNTYIVMIAICCIFVNLKFTGLLCCGVIAAVYYIYLLIKNRKSKEISIIFKRLTMFFLVAFSTSIFLVGSNSYIKNLVEHGNPLYPIIGKGKVDIITTMQPKSFKNKNQIEKFIISTFSRTDNTTYEKKPKYKMPYKIYKSEIKELIYADTRISGFGPLFALILLYSTILYIFIIIVIIKKEKQNLKYILLPFISIIISMILIGESWWARYVPQFYIIPVSTIILLVYLRKYYNKNVLKIATYILIAIITINTNYFFQTKNEEIKIFDIINKDIIEMKTMKNLELKPAVSNLYGYLYTLNDNNIKYKLLNEIAEENKRYMYYWRIEVKTENERLSKID